MAYITKRGKVRQVRHSRRRKKIVQQPDGSYKVDYVLEQVSKSGFKTKRTAQEYAAQLELESAKGYDITANPSFAEYFEDWYIETKKDKIRNTTLVKYIQDSKRLYDYFGFEKLKKIKRIDYQRFMNTLDLAPDSVKMINRRYRACIRYAIRDGIISRDFTDGVELKGNDKQSRATQYLSLAEIKKLLSVAIATRNPRYTSSYMIITALLTGARYGEIAGLQWSDLDSKANTIRINKSYNQNTKTNGPTKNLQSIRTIIVSPTLVKLMLELKQNGSNFIFGSVGLKIPPATNNVGSVLRNLMKKAKITKKDFVFHSLRHCHVALLHSQGIDWYAISKRLGHKDLNVTLKIYAYMLDEDKRKSDTLISNKLEKIVQQNVQQKYNN